jgi:ferrous iron transport protein A
LSIQLSLLAIGQHAELLSYTDVEVNNKMLEMGFLPGSKIEVESKAPLGCPVVIAMGNHRLSLRRSEAQSVIVELLP